MNVSEVVRASLRLLKNSTKRAIDDALRTQMMVPPIIVTPEELPEEG
ncbi:MAG: hypothetical protein HQL75_16365 [Magnetococcales bacterium]|nr:hypothetical protein [Magnetococcales bacterium]